MICLVFYTCNKLTMCASTLYLKYQCTRCTNTTRYIFLLERARVVRAPFMPRHKDFIWLIGLFIMLGGFGSIAIVGYLSPVVELSHLDGRCRIGLPPKVSFPLLCFDVAVNFLLTGVFFWLLRPVLEFHGIMRGRNCCGLFRGKARREKRDEGPRSQENENLQLAMNVNIKALLWKCLIGSALVMLPTVGNMAQFYAMDSRELGWVCLTLCTFDSKSKSRVFLEMQGTDSRVAVSWGVIIVNWLTIGSAKAESNLTTLMSQRTLCNNSKNDVAPFLRLQGKRKPGLLSTGMEMQSGNFTPPKAQGEMLCEVISFKDEGGLLKNDRVSKVWDAEREVGIEEPGKAWQGQGATNAADNNGKRFTL